MAGCPSESPVLSYPLRFAFDLWFSLASPDRISFGIILRGSRGVSTMSSLQDLAVHIKEHDTVNHAAPNRLQTGLVFIRCLAGAGELESTLY